MGSGETIKVSTRLCLRIMAFGQSFNFIIQPRRIDYYGVTFDHLVPTDDLDPEVLQINIIEMDDDQGAYANEHLPFEVDPTEYTGKVLAVPRCCQKRKGTQDRERVNVQVAERNSIAL